MRELHDEVLSLIHRVSESEPATLTLFPVDRYILSAILAIINDARGDHSVAAEHAKGALEVADLKHSGLRYHPTLGLVEEKDTALYRSICAIAG